MATVTEKDAEFEAELTVEKGLGYVPAEARKSEKLPIGVIALDAIFSPVLKVNFSVESMRVGERTDYDRLRLNIGTDGSITPSQALRKASKILEDHFSKISGIEILEAKPIEPAPDKAVKKEKKKTGRKKKEEKKE